MHVCVCVCVRVRKYICIRVCMVVFIHTHIHTRKHTPTHTHILHIQMLGHFVLSPCARLECVKCVNVRVCVYKKLCACMFVRVCMSCVVYAGILKHIHPCSAYCVCECGGKGGIV